MSLLKYEWRLRKVSKTVITNQAIGLATLQVPQEFEIISISISGTTKFVTIRQSGGSGTMTLGVGDKVTFTIPYVTKISSCEHIRGHSEQLKGVNGCEWIEYKYCPKCKEEL